MKYTKRLLISMSFFAFLLTVSGCTSEEVIDGGSKEHPVVQTIRATKSDFITTQEVDVPLTRTTIDGYKTTFSDGDKIGLFAIKNGDTVDGISNMPLTCSVATDGSNTTNWTLPIDTKIYYYKGVTYIAYYPYKEGISITPTQTTQDIVKSLVENNNLQPNEDQSATDGYASSDLMIATANADASEILNVTLSLEFKHQFSLLVMTPQIYTANIIAPENAGFTYRYKNKWYDLDSNAQDVTLSGIKAFKMLNGNFHAIVNTTTIAKGLSVDYKSSGKLIHYQGSDISNLSQGKYYALTVKNIILSEDEGAHVRPLAPGDFVFHGDKGIEIYPGDGELDENGKIPDYDKAVGIVVTCNSDRMTDKKCNANGWNHAYVIGLDDNTKKSESDHSWSLNNSNPYLTSYTTIDGAKDNMNGYIETDTVLKNCDITNDFATYRLSLPVIRKDLIPTELSKLRSEWFIPSVGQYYDLLMNLCGANADDFDKTNDYTWTAKSELVERLFNNLNSHYEKVGKSVSGYQNIANKYWCHYWCSSQYDASNNWRITLLNSKIELSISGKREGHIIYGFFAF